MKPYQKRLHEKFDQFEIEQDDTKRQLLANEIFAILEIEEDLTSNDYHIWGLVYYSLSAEEFILKKAIEKFLLAVAANESNFLAYLYIAHCYHDLKDWENALIYYEKVDHDSLKAFQKWRYVKLIEQIGCCYYYLGDKREGRSIFLAVIELYKELPKMERPVPRELLGCLLESDEIAIEIKTLTRRN